MLPDDTKARRMALSAETLRQTEVEDHFTKQKPEDKPPPYSDKFFEEALIQWLIQTDQVRLPYSITASMHVETISLAYSGIRAPRLQENHRDRSSCDTRR
jgi:hypothetical protein